MKQNVLSGTIYIFLFFSVFIFAAINNANCQGKGRIQGHVVSYGDREAPNSLVFIEDLTGDFEPPEEHAVIDQINTEFVPRMLPVLKGTTVDFLNSDAGWHNVYSPSQSVTPFNLGTYPPGQSRSMTFDNIGVAPISCSMHSGMRTYVIILGNPYFSVTDKTGIFEINDVPTGTYSLRVWHERWHTEKQKITVEDGKIISVNFTLR